VLGSNLHQCAGELAWELVHPKLQYPQPVLKVMASQSHRGYGSNEMKISRNGGYLRQVHLPLCDFLRQGQSVCAWSNPVMKWREAEEGMKS
jgi:hypothetical protein